MSLISLEYYNEADTSKKVEFGRTAKDMMIINPFRKHIEIRFTEVVKVAGNEYNADKQFVLYVKDEKIVPVVDADLNPVMVDNPNYNDQIDESKENPSQIQKMASEYDYWKVNFFDNAPQVGLGASLENGLKQKLVELYGATFDPAPQPLVFIEP